MKGVPGLLLALGLGIAGALCNWFYMAQKARDLDLVNFIGIKGGIKAGDVFKREDLMEIPVPQRYAVRLREAAPTFSILSTVVGSTAYRDFRDGEILLQQDLDTPPGDDLTKDLGPKEQVVWVTVDSRGFVPQFLAGGQKVSFRVVRSPSSYPQEVQTNGRRLPTETEVIGPFHVLALGNRRGSYQRSRAAGFSNSQENIIAIRVTRVSDTELDPKAQLLLERLRLSNNQALGIVLHSEADE